MTDVRPFRSSLPELVPGCRPVATAAELADHHRIRRAVFVAEQGLFDGSDRDDRDDGPDTVHVLGFVDGEPAGTVRLFPLSGTLWHGDRLAVLPGFRRTRIGGRLVRLAVALAGERGGTRMQARVQLPNVPFFVYLGWTPTAPPADHLGMPHQWMAIPLGPVSGQGREHRSEAAGDREGASQRGTSEERTDRGVGLSSRARSGAPRGSEPWTP